MNRIPSHEVFLPPNLSGCGDGLKVRIFYCPFCEMCSSYSSVIKSHLETKHPNGPQPAPPAIAGIASGGAGIAPVEGPAEAEAPTPAEAPVQAPARALPAQALAEAPAQTPAEAPAGAPVEAEPHPLLWSRGELVC